MPGCAGDVMAFGVSRGYLGVSTTSALVLFCSLHFTLLPFTSLHFAFGRHMTHRTHDACLVTQHRTAQHRTASTSWYGMAWYKNIIQYIYPSIHPWSTTLPRTHIQLNSCKKCIIHSKLPLVPEFFLYDPYASAPAPAPAPAPAFRAFRPCAGILGRLIPGTKPVSCWARSD